MPRPRPHVAPEHGLAAMGREGPCSGSQPPPWPVSREHCQRCFRDVTQPAGCGDSRQASEFSLKSFVGAWAESWPRDHLLYLFKKAFIFTLCGWVFACVPICITWMRGACGVQKNVSESLELGLLMLSATTIWVLGVEPRTSAKTASALHHGAIPPAPTPTLLKQSPSSSMVFFLPNLLR